MPMHHQMRFRTCLALLAAAALLAGVVAPAGAATPAPGAHGDDFSGTRTSEPVAVPAPATERAARARRAVTLGPREMAVILLNFPNDTREPWTPAFVAERVFTASDSLSAFYAEESHGAISFTGDVYGWYTGTTESTDCDLATIRDEAHAAAAGDGFAVGDYDHVMLVMPYVPTCDWAGTAALPGVHSWINGSLSIRLLAHEVGHNLGVHHASGYACTENGQPVPISSTCTLDEYGDPFSVMGRSPHHNHAWHLQQIGTLPATKVQTVTATGTYTLHATASDAAATPTALRIPRTRDDEGDPVDYYYLDLRAAWGAFDVFGATDPAVRGVTLRINPDPSVVRQSYLIDTTANSPSNTDAPLAVGRTFTEGDVSITTTAVGDGVATVAVAIGPPPGPGPDPPSAPQEPTETAEGGDPGAEPPTEAPGPPIVVPPRITEEPRPAPDVSRPRVGVRVQRLSRRRIRIRATATDNRAVTRVELWIDGRRRRLTGRAWTGRLNRLRTRRHLIVVKAFDAAGNEGRVRTLVR
jgi:hypothetical protein